MYFVDDDPVTFPSNHHANTELSVFERLSSSLGRVSLRNQLRNLDPEKFVRSPTSLGNSRRLIALKHVDSSLGLHVIKPRRKQCVERAIRALK